LEPYYVDPKWVNFFDGMVLNWRGIWHLKDPEKNILSSNLKTGRTRILSPREYYLKTIAERKRDYRTRDSLTI
jgi:hypothetical protein